MGRRDEAHVERDLLVAADRAHRSRLEGAEKLRLHLQRHLADLVEQERALVRLTAKSPLRSLRASVNAPRTWPKSSLSRRFAGTAAQLMVTIGASQRRLRR